MIPLVLRRLARGGGRFLGAVAFEVVNVSISAVVEQSVVRPGRIAGHRPIAVGIVTVKFVGLVIMVGGGELARRVVGVIACSVFANLLGDPAEIIEGPAVRGEKIRTALLVVQERRKSRELF